MEPVKEWDSDVLVVNIAKIKAEYTNLMWGNNTSVTAKKVY